jgi:hypothetical protein
MRLHRIFFAAIAAALPLALSHPAQAADCTGTYSIAQLESLGATGCKIGDKIYSNFSFTGISTGNYSFSLLDVDHTFSGSGLNFMGSSFSYSYDVALAGAIPGQEFLSFVTAATGTATAGSLVYTKTLSVPAQGLTSTGSNTGTATPVDFDPGTVGPVSFTGSLTRTAGRINFIEDTLSQKFAEPPAVPSPLPIFGAAAAFGYSRKLRRRIPTVR